MGREKMAWRLWRALAALVSLAALAALAGAANAGELQFRLKPPTQPVAIFGTAWTIYADGEIDDAAADRLQSLVAQNRIPGRSTIYLNSPGGSLLGGLKLGRAIRANGFDTVIGRWSEPAGLAPPGDCYSACALAFLGGRFRSEMDGSRYGVHRFYSSAPTNPDPEMVQMISALIAGYMSEMGVDQRLFGEMSFTSSTAINILPEARMKALRVINDGQTETVWTLESIDGGMYVKGERDTFRGINKFMIACSPQKQLALYVIFDAQNRDDELAHLRAISLFSNGKTIPLLDHLAHAPAVANGLVNIMLRLDQPLINRIRTSDTVGIAVQYSYEAPSFFGFDGMPISGGRAKIESLLSLCRT